MEPPKNLGDFCSKGILCLPDNWLHEIWARTWDQGNLGIVSHSVVRDEPPISLDLPSNCFVMEECHPDEFESLMVSKMYIRDSFVGLARSIMAFYREDTASATAETTGFRNPFLGFKSKLRRHVIVTGTPGNGKTMFLYFLLRCRLHAKLLTILQLRGGGFYLFSKFGVHRFPAEPFSADMAVCLSRIMPGTWCLVDSNNYHYEPSDFLASSKLPIIQSASPHQKRFEWLGKTGVVPGMFYMPPFTLEEAIVARSMQLTRSSEYQLREWFDNYIPSARLAYMHAANLGAYEDTLFPRLIARIKNPRSLTELVGNVISFMDDNISHQLFVFLPYDNYRKYTCNVPTQHLCMKLIESCCLEDEEQRKQSYRIFVSSKHLAAPAGYIMEQLFHALLPLGGSWPLLELSTDNYDVNQHWSVCSSNVDEWLLVDIQNQPALQIASACPSTDFPHRGSLEVKRYDTLDTLADNCFYIPNTPNQPTFDSFYHSAGHVCMFQCTVTDTEHTMNNKGLEMMRKLGVEKVIYVGVVPTGRRPKFIINNATAEKYKDLLHARYLLEVEF